MNTVEILTDITRNNISSINQYCLRDLKLHPCCMNHCRDWRETLRGALPASDHAPSCPNYKTQAYFRIRLKGEKGNACILETQAEIDSLTHEFPQETYEISTIQLTPDQFKKLQDFEGF